jgi:hypothetical protein
MPVSKTTIFNLAAGHVGVKPVTTDSESSVVALAMTRAYPTARQEALRRIAPGFATVIQTLNEVADYTPPPGWSYGYSKPATCIAMMKIYGAYQAGIVLDSAGRPDQNAQAPVIDFPPFRKIYDATLAVEIYLSNVEDAYGEWIYDLDDASKFDASFVKGIALALAAESCMGLTGDDAKAAKLINLFNVQYGEAARLDSYETKAKPGNGSIVDSR